jgi:hypothetical protein
LDALKNEGIEFEEKILLPQSKADDNALSLQFL